MMTRTTDRTFIGGASRLAVGAATLALVAGGLGLTGCSALAKLHKVVDDLRGNKETIDAFTSTMQSNQDVTFEATYVTTGRAPATIVYAVQPPTGLAFIDTPSQSSPTTTGTGDNLAGGVRIIVNSAGEFVCTPPSSGAGSGSKWSCEKLPKAAEKTENAIFGFYTPAHWVNFLKIFSLAAGFAGDSVTSSSLTVNGFPMHCVDFVATGVKGTSTICTTSQGILGYVKVAGDSTSFEIKSYSSSPSTSLFQLPAGATVTTIPTSVTSTTS